MPEEIASEQSQRQPKAARPLARGNMDGWICTRPIRISQSQMITPGQKLVGWGRARMRRWARRRACGPEGHQWTEARLAVFVRNGGELQTGEAKAPRGIGRPKAFAQALAGVPLEERNGYVPPETAAEIEARQLAAFADAIESMTDDQRKHLSWLVDSQETENVKAFLDASQEIREEWVEAQRVADTEVTEVLEAMLLVAELTDEQSEHAVTLTDSPDELRAFIEAMKEERQLAGLADAVSTMTDEEKAFLASLERDDAEAFLDDALVTRANAASDETSPGDGAEPSGKAEPNAGGVEAGTPPNADTKTEEELTGGDGLDSSSPNTSSQGSAEGTGDGSGNSDASPGAGPDTPSG